MRLVRISRWPAFALAFLSLAGGPAMRASTPPPHVAPPSGASRGAVFGIIATDPAGKPFFVRSDSVPNVEGQMYGWFIGVGDSRGPVGWSETLTLPAPPASWSREGSHRDSDLSVSPAGRSAVVRGESVPEYGAIYHFWAVAPGDPVGRYTIVVKLADGREERFAFALLAKEKERPKPDLLGGAQVSAARSPAPAS